MPKPLKLFLIGIAILVVLVALVPIMLFALQQVSYGFWNKTFATYHGQIPATVVVHGDTDNLVVGWNVSLLWKKEDDKWFVYYLDHESFLLNEFALKDDGENIDVYCNDVLIGKLDTKKSEFFHIRQNFLYKKPIAVIHGANMDDYQKWLYWVDEKGNRQ